MDWLVSDPTRASAGFAVIMWIVFIVAYLWMDL